MKKIIIVIVLCLINLFIVTPKSFEIGRNRTKEIVSECSPSECEKEIKKINDLKTYVDSFTLIILILSIVVLINKSTD